MKHMKKGFYTRFCVSDNNTYRVAWDVQWSPPLTD